MFKSRRAKILFWPQEEEILEVLGATPELHQIVALSKVEYKGKVEGNFYGTVTDYDGIEYDFEWDPETQRLVRLVGSQVNVLIWGLASSLIKEQLPKPVEVPLEDKLESKLKQHLEVAVNDLVGQFNVVLDEHFETLDSSLRELQKPVTVIQETPRPVMEIEVPRITRPVEVEPELSIAEEQEDFSTNALKFLQESAGEDLQIDYLSL